MQNINKARGALLGAIAFVAGVSVYLFGLSPESNQGKLLLDIVKVVLVLLELSMLTFFAFLWSEDFYHTSYSRYMETVWDSWKEYSGVSVCRGSWLTFFTLFLWLVMLASMYAIINTTYSVGTGGDDHFFAWNEKDEFTSMLHLIVWSISYNIVFTFLYWNLVLKYKANSTVAFYFLALFVSANVGFVWILGGIQTFGWSAVLGVFYWLGIVVFAICLVVAFVIVIAKLQMFKGVTAQGSLFMQNITALYKGFCPIIPKKGEEEKSK